MSRIGRYAPWFRHRSNGESIAYRTWKWALQKRSALRWNSDLLTRIERTNWDLLVILDACRYDTLAAVADCAVIGRAISPASATPGFLEKCAETGVFEGAVYVSGNPQTNKRCPVPETDHVDIAATGWDEYLETVPPDAVYEEAFAQLDAGKRVVAHTIQPHYPHVCRIGDSVAPVPGGLHPEYLDCGSEGDFRIQPTMASGRIDLERARRSYEIAAKFAWDRAVEAAADALEEGHRVCITADHGELFGDWGLVEHPVRTAVRPLVEVPWVVFEPPAERSRNGDTTVSERLAALGYTE